LASLAWFRGKRRRLQEVVGAAKAAVAAEKTAGINAGGAAGDVNEREKGSWGTRTSP
jgi:hypothetical protein